jgi:hypothetical protein
MEAEPSPQHEPVARFMRSSLRRDARVARTRHESSEARRRIRGGTRVASRALMDPIVVTFEGLRTSRMAYAAMRAALDAAERQMLELERRQEQERLGA